MLLQQTYSTPALINRSMSVVTTSASLYLHVHIHFHELVQLKAEAGQDNGVTKPKM